MTYTTELDRRADMVAAQVLDRRAHAAQIRANMVDHGDTLPPVVVAAALGIADRLEARAEREGH